MNQTWLKNNVVAILTAFGLTIGVYTKLSSDVAVLQTEIMLLESSKKELAIERLNNRNEVKKLNSRISEIEGINKALINGTANLTKVVQQLNETTTKLAVGVGRLEVQVERFQEEK